MTPGPMSELVVSTWAWAVFPVTLSVTSKQSPSQIRISFASVLYGRDPFTAISDL